MAAPATSPPARDLSAARSFAAVMVGRMTLREKAGQMAQADKHAVTPDEVAEYGLGSVLSGGGGNPTPNTPAGWASMVGEFVAASRRSRLGIPILYATDAVHGHSNVVGATIFPHNIGLGAAGDPDLVERVYRATAVEVAATGARWDFAPTIAVALDPRWGRTYEAFGDDPELVSALGAAAVRGLQGAALDAADSVLACVKHFAGDGGTRWGTAPRYEWTDWWDGWGTHWHIDQGDTMADETTMRTVHLRPYVDAVAAGALSVMASYSSWNGVKCHGHRRLLTDVLKGEFGFGGFVVSDWMGIDQLDPDPYRAVVLAIGAGVDMVMVPFEFRRFIDDVVSAVEAGDIPVGRIDDAVGRILTVKHAMGLFGDDGTRKPALETVGSHEHRSLGREAAAASVVRLHDPGNVLPLPSGRVLVAGRGADDIGLQCGGWTIEWQGGVGPITNGTTILDGLRAVPPLDVVYEPGAHFESGVTGRTGVAVVAEPPHAEGVGDRGDLALPAEDVAMIDRLRQRVDHLVMVVVSARPLLIDAVIDRCDAIVAAWLPGTEGAGVADVLSGSRPFRGRLPRAWPSGPGEGAAEPFGDDRWPRGHGAVS